MFLEKAAIVLIVLTSLWATVMQCTSVSYIVKGGEKPILQAELARSAEDLEAAVNNSATPSQRRDNINMVIRNTHLDYVFIALYWMTFLAISGVVARVSSRSVGIFTAALITVAAVFDLIENRALLKALHAGLPLPRFNDDMAAQAISNPSLVKWFFIFGTLLVVGTALLFGSKSPLVLRAAGVLFLAGGLLGFTGAGKYRPLLTSERIKQIGEAPPGLNGIQQTGLSMGLAALGLFILLAWLLYALKTGRELDSGTGVPMSASSGF
jgi:hypothetical protein